MKQYEIHPLAKLLPPLTEAERAALKESIVGTKGPVDELVLLDGKILDGRHRYGICVECKLDFKTRKFDPKRDGTPATFVVAKATGRHMNESQKACAAVALADEMEKEAKERSKANLRRGDKSSTSGRKPGEFAIGDTVVATGFLEEISAGDLGTITATRKDHPLNLCVKWEVKAGEKRNRTSWTSAGELKLSAPGKTRDLAAGLFGCSGSYVQMAKAVREHDPKLFQSVFEGSVKLTSAKQEIGRHAKRTKLAKAPKVIAPPGGGMRWDVLTGDAKEKLETLARRSVRLAFVDSPYNEGLDYGDGPKADALPDADFLGYWGKVFQYIAGELLTDDGSLWVLINDEYAAEFCALLKAAGLKLINWIKWYETFGVNCPNKFNRTSRHLFYFAKDEKRRVFNHDAVNRPSARQTTYGDKRANPKGKNHDDVWTDIPRLQGTAAERLPDFQTQLPEALLLRIVGVASEPGDLVLDPCSGSATTGAACVQLGRRFVGIEKNKARAEQSRARLSALTPASGK